MIVLDAIDTIACYAYFVLYCTIIYPKEDKPSVHIYNMFLFILHLWPLMLRFSGFWFLFLSWKKKKKKPRRRSEGFPDWIEQWNPRVFRQVGYGMVASAAAVGMLGGPTAGAILAVPVGLYWWVGLRDLQQESHSLKRNFPVLANVRRESMRRGCILF